MKINETSIIAESPVKLLPGQAWRSYTGGKLIGKLHGITNPFDSNFPEEWIASTITARNPGCETKREGLSYCVDAEMSLKDLLESYPEKMLGFNHRERFGEHIGVLVKLIDSAERLTIQVHPDKENAMRLFNSPFGKTECWHILGVRNGLQEPPCIYLGFKPGISRRFWENCFKNQDIDKMLGCLHRLEVKTGDTFLVEGGVPHAIGEGCFLLEIQEPTDYTIRTERRSPSGMEIPDSMCHQGLGFSQMFDCFKYEGLSHEQIIKRWNISPKSAAEASNHSEKILIDYDRTSCFKMSLLKVFSSGLFCSDKKFSVIYILSGHGEIISKDNIQTLSQGDQFFLPASTGTFKIISSGSQPLVAIRCWGPQ